MPYEKNKTTYQDEAWFEREQRNILDENRWNRQLLGQPFYSIYGDNKNLYKEVRFKNNWITDGELDAILSEPKSRSYCLYDYDYWSLSHLIIPYRT